MPQSLANILVHLIFSTAGREPLLKDEWRDELHAYLGGVVRSKGSALLAVNSVTDHIHLLFPLPRTCSMADFVRDLKTSTSNWIEQKLAVKRFHWQTGYGAFSVSGSHKESVEKYIAEQQERHRKISFQDEFRKMLEKTGTPFDERYVWD